MPNERQLPEGPPTRQRREAWGRYWGSGAAHSCVGTFGDRYGGAIADFWRHVFADLADGARVLDVATGNGALPRLLLDHCHDPGVTCDAIDVAEVRPSWVSLLPEGERSRVRFHGGVDAASLPFEDRCFDLVVSQYGFEYAEFDRALPEVLRVRAPRGGIAMVLHHAGGRPAALAAIEIDHLRWLLNAGGFFDAAAALVEPMARAATPEGRAALRTDAAANAARERFNAVQGELSRRATGDGADVLFEARDAMAAIFSLAGRQGAAAARDTLHVMREDYAASEARLHDLREHALDAVRAASLRDRMASAVGASGQLGVLREPGGYLMGWTLKVFPPR